MFRTLAPRRARLRLARRQRGVSLIETSLVMTVGFLLIMGIVAAAPGDPTPRASYATSELAALQKNVRALYSSQTSYDGLENKVLLNQRAIPTRMIDYEGERVRLRHAFNGPLTVAAADGGRTFRVAFEGVPVDGCVNLASIDYGTGLDRLEIVVPDAAPATLKGPIPPAAARQACDSNRGTVTLAWVFH